MRRRKMRNPFRKIAFALMASATIQPALAIESDKDVRSMPDRSFICDSAYAPPQRVQVWVQPSKRLITSQFDNENGPVETYYLTALSPVYQTNGSWNWDWAAHIENTFTTTQMMWNDGQWTYSSRGHATYNCTEFYDPDNQPPQG
jgi:hypothetical protein